MGFDFLSSIFRKILDSRPSTLYHFMQIRRSGKNMKVSKKIKETIKKLPVGTTFKYQELNISNDEYGAAAKAIDQLVGVDPENLPPAADKLRRLLHFGQVLQSHALHFFHLSSPDLLAIELSYSVSFLFLPHLRKHQLLYPGLCLNYIYIL